MSRIRSLLAVAGALAISATAAQALVGPSNPASTQAGIIVQTQAKGRFFGCRTTTRPYAFGQVATAGRRSARCNFRTGCLCTVTICFARPWRNSVSCSPNIRAPQPPVPRPPIPRQGPGPVR